MTMADLRLERSRGTPRRLLTVFVALLALPEHVLARPPPSALPCLAFIHQPRSAGLVVWGRGLMQGERRHHHHCWQLTYMNRKQCTGWKHYEDADFYWGDMATALNSGERSPTLRRGCRWFTMFREPVERMVSALHHCRNRKPKAWIPLCGLNAGEGAFSARPVDETSATLRQWAAHYGSYFYRQLLYDMRLFERVGLRCRPNATAPLLPSIAPTRRARGGGARECRYPKSWTELRDALGDAADGKSTPEARILVKELVHSIENGTRFVTVGLLERWEESARLFDAHVPLVAPPSVRTARALARRPAVSSWRQVMQPASATTLAKRAREAADVEAARADPEVLAHLETDLKLYDAAKRLFERQLVALGSAAAPLRARGL